jgi:uncharacterized repeat protein (TIGR01451 family)
MSDERNRQLLTTALAAVLLWVSSMSAQAQEQGYLNVKTVVQKEVVTVNDKGEPEAHLVPAETVVPGENIVITTTFTNIGDKPAENVVITNPIAESLIYVEGSAFGPGTIVQFSVDGGKTFADRESLTVIEDGVERPANANDFTHIRWVMQQDLAAGAQGVARFSAVLE